MRFFRRSAAHLFVHAADDPRYLARISGLLLDRIDLHIQVPAVKYKELRDDEGSSFTLNTTQITRSRTKNPFVVFSNGDVRLKGIEKYSGFRLG